MEIKLNKLKCWQDWNLITYTDRNLMVESTIFDGKPEPLGISAS